MQCNFDDVSATATLTGEFTFADHGVFRTMIGKLVKAKDPTCVLDLSRLEFIDSAGLGMLLIARDEAKKANHALVLRHPTGQVKRMLEISKFGTQLTIQP